MSAPLSFALNLAGTPHDLTSQIGYPSSAGGLCGACHSSHWSMEKRLWVRDADQNGVNFNITNVTGLCFDCHSTGPGAVVWTNPAPVWAHTPFSAYRLSGDAGPPTGTGSHDMTKSPAVAPRGSCSGCHNLHTPSGSSQAYQGSASGDYLANGALWSRAITTKLQGIYQKRDMTTLSQTSGMPNYIVGSTLLCLDCHSGNMIQSLPNTLMDFVSPRQSPVNVAFSSDYGAVDGSVGYYELSNGSLPSAANTAPTLLAVKRRNRNPGGHHVITGMNYTGVGQSTLDNFAVRGPGGRLLYKISVGDKLPCDLCHDPHMGVVTLATDDQVFFRRNIQGGLGTIARNPSQAFANSIIRASGKTRNGDGDGRKACFYCHGSSDWDKTTWTSSARFIAPLRVGNSAVPVTIYGIRINMKAGSDKPTDGSSWAFPPPRNIPEHAYSTGSVTVPCTNCHLHNNIGASCSGCHAYPPFTGAHAIHYDPPPKGPGLNCQACHGPNPGTAPTWHNQTRGAYNSTTNYGNITLMPNLTPAQRGAAEDAYYNTTWSRSGASQLATLVKAPGYRFVCTNVYCHGMHPVNWTWKANTATNPAPSAGYMTCGGCHGMGSNPTTRTLYTSSFRTRLGTKFEASPAAVNYSRPLSRFSRGGHGDVNIKAQAFSVNSAPNRQVPVACVNCHNDAANHFAVAGSNPYRISNAALGTTIAGYDARVTRVTNLCTQTNCHPKLIAGGAYAALQRGNPAHRHGMDHYPLVGTLKTYYIKTSVPPKRILQTGAGSRLAPVYNPFDLGAGTTPVGSHIDRYVDHWAWWGTPATVVTTDNHPFLPLGDSLQHFMANSAYNNVASSTNLVNGVVTCITCHNPHGTDLRIAGRMPGTGTTATVAPDNKMLRIRWQEDVSDELCLACH